METKSASQEHTFSHVMSIDDIENEREATLVQLSVLQQALKDSEARCTALEATVAQLTGKNSRLETGCSALEKVLSPCYYHF